MHGIFTTLAVLVTCAYSQLTGENVTSGESCTTPRNVSGVCMDIKQCPFLLDYLVNKRNEPGIKEYLQGSVCSKQDSQVIACCPTQERNLNMTEISLKAQKLPYDVCGQSDIFKQKLDGAKATLGAYPWMAAIGYTKTNKSGIFWICAGNLVTDQYILTAAHCLVYSSSRKLSVVRLGDLDLNDEVNDGASPVDIEVEKNITHPEYTTWKKMNDIGLVKLKNKVQFDYTKKPICLPFLGLYETSFVGYSSAIIGWGRNEKGVSTSLNEAPVDIKDFESCKRNYTSKIQVIMDERVFCASSPGRDACQGDSGGPLMMYRKYEGKYRMFILGLVSYGYGCGVDGYPGVYTNVSSFMAWIVNNLEM